MKIYKSKHLLFLLITGITITGIITSCEKEQKSITEESGKAVIAERTSQSSSNDSVWVFTKDRTVDNAIKAVEFQLNYDLGNRKILNGEIHIESSESDTLNSCCNINLIDNISEMVTISEQIRLYDEIKTRAVSKMNDKQLGLSGKFILFDLDRKSNTYRASNTYISTTFLFGKEPISVIKPSNCSFNTIIDWETFSDKLESYINKDCQPFKKVTNEIITFYDIVPYPRFGNQMVFAWDCMPFDFLTTSMSTWDQNNAKKNAIGLIPTYTNIVNSNLAPIDRKEFIYADFYHGKLLCKHEGDGNIIQGDPMAKACFAYSSAYGGASTHCDIPKTDNDEVYRRIRHNYYFGKKVITQPGDPID